MLTVLLALLLQTTTTISGNLVPPPGMPPPESAEVVLLPAQYAQMFNAEAQQRIDDYWEAYKREFAANKELFFKVQPVAYREALDIVLVRMNNRANFVRKVSGGRFEFRGVAPGEYKIVALGSIRNTDYVWTESFQVAATPVALLVKTRVP
jgi:hypothetical protein